MGTKKKSMAPLIIAVAVVAAVLGAVGAYSLTQGDYQRGIEAGKLAQKNLQDSNVPASLTCSLASSTFADFGTAVAADGSVSTETNTYTNLTITNSDTARDAGGVQVSLYNRATDTEGLDNDLEDDKTEYTVTSGGGSYKLYNDGAYVQYGLDIGDIPPGGEWVLPQIMTLEVASAGTYEDGQSYTCHVYIYQEAADYANVVDFTVAT